MISTTTALDKRTLSINVSLSTVYGIVLVLLLYSVFILSFLFKDNRLWLDEVFSMILLTDSSFIHMNDAVASGIETNPPLFFCLYWFIGHTISIEPIFLKIVSVVLFLISIYIFYKYTNQLLSNPTIVFLIFITALALTQLNTILAPQIRCYSLYLLLFCLYIIVIHKLFSKPADYYLLAAHQVIGLSLMLTHNYGIFLVAIPTAIFFPLFIWSKQKRYLIPLISGGIIFGLWAIIWFKSFLTQSQASKPHFWIQKPTFLSFFKIVGDLIPKVPKVDVILPHYDLISVLFIVSLFSYIFIKRFKLNFDGFIKDKSFSFFLLSTYVFISTIIAALLVSIFYVPILINRYLWPLHLLLIYNLVYISILYKNKKYNLPNHFTLLLAGYLFLLGTLMFHQVKRYSAFPKVIANILPKLDNKIPIFFETLYYYLPLNYYHLGNTMFWLDWQTSKMGNTTSEYKALSLFQKKYSIPGVVSSGDFNIKKYSRFYVLDESNKFKFEPLISKGQIKIVNIIPTKIDGIRILECIQ